MAFVVSAATGGFDEQFNDGNASNWTQHSGTWAVVDNEYYYTTGVSNQWAVSTYNAEYDDLDYSARVRRFSADNESSNSLIIRASGATLSDGLPAEGYLFSYTRSGNFSVRKRVDGQVTIVVPLQASTAIDTGEAFNTLRVVAIGDQLAFYINGTKVWEGSDNSLTSGRVGVGVSRNPESTGDEFFVDWATLSENPAG